MPAKTVISIFLDECVPKKLKRELGSYATRHISEMHGWPGTKNGALLRLVADAGFDIFLTTDQSLRYQQNLSKFPLAYIVLIAPSNKMKHLRPLAPRVLATLETIQTGALIEIKA